MPYLLFCAILMSYVAWEPEKMNLKLEEEKDKISQVLRVLLITFLTHSILYHLCLEKICSVNT